MKSDAARHLVAAVDSLARHEVFYTPQASRKIAPELAEPAGRLAARSGRKRRARDQPRARGGRVGRWRVIATSRSAVALGICAKTVETHRANVMHKLGLKHTAELVRYAMRDGLIQP